MKDNIIFDFDGTVVNTFPGVSKSINFALEKAGRSKLEPQILRKFLGPAIYDSLRDYAELTGEKADEAVRYFRADYENGRIYDCDLFEGIEELLKNLKDNGFVLSIASSKPLESIKKLLHKFGIEKYFDKVVGPDYAAKDSGKKELLKQAVLSENALMVGDRKFDIEAANALKIESVGVLYGFGGKEELQKSGATYLAETPAEVYKIALLKRGDKI